jgi:hypothetical protein
LCFFGKTKKKWINKNIFNKILKILKIEEYFLFISIKFLLIKIFNFSFFNNFIFRDYFFHNLKKINKKINYLNFKSNKININKFKILFLNNLNFILLFKFYFILIF